MFKVIFELKKKKKHSQNSISLYFPILPKEKQNEQKILLHQQPHQSPKTDQLQTSLSLFLSVLDIHKQPMSTRNDVEYFREFCMNIENCARVCEVWNVELDNSFFYPTSVGGKCMLCVTPKQVLLQQVFFPEIKKKSSFTCLTT